MYCDDILICISLLILIIGYVVDEIDGRYFVIKSDDPDDIENGVTWTVSSTYVSTVPEFITDHQLQTMPLPLKFPSETVKSRTKQHSKEIELYLSCLETELAKNEKRDNRTQT